MAVGSRTPPTTPRAPTEAEWACLSPEERARVVAELPSWMTDAEVAPPEGDPHRDAKMSAHDVLKTFFHKTGRSIYVAAELTVYYPGEPRFAPDLLAVRDVPVHPRMKWVVSAEGKGLDWVMEVHVAGERRKDLERNVGRYARLGIREYFVYDRGRGELLGFRQAGPDAGRYAPIPAAGGRLASGVLGLDLVVEGERLRFYEGNAQLLEPAELAEKLEQMVTQVGARAAAAEEARAAAEEARLAGLRSACVSVAAAKAGIPAPPIQAQVAAVSDPTALERLLVDLGMASDAAAVRAVLAKLA